MAQKMLLLVAEPADSESASRVEVIREMMEADPAKQHRTILKFRLLFEEELSNAMSNGGKLADSCWDFVDHIAIQWRGCTQEIEGINNMIKAIVRRAPSISLPLVSARLAIRKGLNIVGCRGPEARKWSR